MNDFTYQNPVERLDEFIDKMARGIMPMVDEITMKEIELRMHELAMEVADDEDNEEEVERLKNDVKTIKEKARETTRKATRKDIIIFTLTEEQKAQLMEDVSSSYVRKEMSEYNIPADKITEDSEKALLQKRVAKIRRCYYHADEWIAAMKTLLDVVEYESKSYPWMSKKEYYQAFWNGTIKLNVLVPILFMDYHTPIKDPELLGSIFRGETIVEKTPEIDRSNRVKLKDDVAVPMEVTIYTKAEIDAMKQLASAGYDTPVNMILKDTRKSIYDRFLPLSKNKKNTAKGQVVNLLREVKRAKKFNGVEMVPYTANDIVHIIHKHNPDKLNTTINTAMDRFLASLQSNKTVKIDTSFNANDVLVNAEAAAKEAAIIANIKSISGQTK